MWKFWISQIDHPQVSVAVPYNSQRPENCSGQGTKCRHVFSIVGVSAGVICAPGPETAMPLLSVLESEAWSSRAELYTAVSDLLAARSISRTAYFMMLSSHSGSRLYPIFSSRHRCEKLICSQLHLLHPQSLAYVWVQEERSSRNCEPRIKALSTRTSGWTLSMCGSCGGAGGAVGVFRGQPRRHVRAKRELRESRMHAARARISMGRSARVRIA